MKNLSLKGGITVLLLVLAAGCSHNEIHSEFHSFPGGKWNKNEAVRFEVVVTDTVSLYDVQIEVRNKNDYPFRNLWLFIDFQTPDGSLRHDTINCELADVYGRWHGKGMSLYTLDFLFEQQVRYPHSGTYTYYIRQGMREDLLNGISDIGLNVLKKSR